MTRAVVHGVLALAVLLPAVLGGLPYVWCAPMARAQLRCCCPSSAEHESEPPAAELTSACCEGRRMAGHATATTAPFVGHEVAPPALVVLLALDALLAPQTVGVEVATHYEWRSRAGPAPPLFELHRVYLI